MNRSSVALSVGMLLSLSTKLPGTISLQRSMVIDGQLVSQQDEKCDQVKEEKVAKTEVTFDDFFTTGTSGEQLEVRSPKEKSSSARRFILSWLVWCAVKAENSYLTVCSWKDRFLAWILHAKEGK